VKSKEKEKAGNLLGRAEAGGEKLGSRKRMTGGELRDRRKSCSKGSLPGSIEPQKLEKKEGSAGTAM